MLLKALFFLIGILLVQYLTVLPNIAGIAVLALLLAFSFWQKNTIWIFFLFGMLWAIISALNGVGDILSKDWENRDIALSGLVIGLPERHEDRVRFNIYVVENNKNLPDKIRLTWYSPLQPIKPGQIWKMTVRLKKPHGLFNPGGFDYQGWLFSQHIGATGYVRSRPSPQLHAAQQSLQFLNVWRQQLADHLTRLFHDSPYLGIIKALCIGDRSSISVKMWDVFRKTGTAHLVAISGLHISLVAGIVFYLALKIWAYSGLLAVSPPKIAAFTALLAALIYAALAGFSLPTQRALIMISVFLVALYSQRHIAESRKLAIALMLILLLDPLAVLSAGFWLSFGAVALIFYCFIGRIGKIGFWQTALKLHVVMALGLMPLMMLHFQQFSVIAPLANLLAVPVMSLFIIPLLLSGIALLAIVPDLSILLIRVAERLLHWLWQYLEYCNDLPLASVSTAKPSLTTVVLSVLGVVVLLAPKGFPMRYLGVFLFLPLLFSEAKRVPNKEIRMTLLDVGQGLATVVETTHHTLVFDTGAKYSDAFDMGRVVLLPYLRFQQINEIDALIISHIDNDHNGGTQFLLDKVPVATVLSSDPGHFRHSAVSACSQKSEWSWDGVGFFVLSPPSNQYFTGENNNSCVLQITTRRHRLLLTGDIEHDAEAWLTLTYANKLKSDILIAPHHGSKTSSSLPFLEAVRPRLVLISAGYLNRYGFPHAEVINRIEALSADWLTTSREGAITIETSQKNLMPISSRKQLGHYWHR